MKRRCVLTIIALLTFASLTAAQVTITQGSVMPIGTSWTSNTMMDVATFDVGQAGENQTWTFGEYTFEYSGSATIVNPDDTPYADQFPTADRALMNEDNTSGTFFRVASEAAYWLGTGSSSGVVVFDNEATIVPFPCTYGSEWTILIHYSAVIGPFTMTHTDSIINVADGWGTIQTQFGTWNVLRVFGHTYSRTDNSITPPIETEYVGYIWYTAAGIDVASVTSDDGVTDPNFTTGFLELCSDYGQAVDPARGPVAKNFAVGQNYPNPFNPSTTLPVELEKNARVDVKVYDATGRLISQEEFNLSPGHHDLRVNGSDWSTGTYFAQVSAGDQRQTVKMQLIK
ncbi:T9SS C-terminal target domain-containing protein [candidate division KSB1 bacterium]|nr:MAG: T9SS C-terminal target domain-containing protein [candidate division KSB1 bacterium]